jgi:hypothetical protein
VKEKHILEMSPAGA